MLKGCFSTSCKGICRGNFRVVWGDAGRDLSWLEAPT